jgi:hypothetical protein
LPPTQIVQKVLKEEYARRVDVVPTKIEPSGGDPAHAAGEIQPAGCSSPWADV